MALQGTLDTFALIDVFRLLASTNKTGRLRVSGDRGTGNVWFDGGGVVLAAAHNTKPSDAPVAVVFELLRQREGSFVFEADVTTPDAGAPSDVETLIREAEHLLIEWQEIEAVVPSVDRWISLATELPRPEVVVDGERWKVIVATGAGATVAEVGDNLGLGEIAVSKAVKEVIEIGLLTISDAPVTAAAPAQTSRVEHIQLVPEVDDESPLEPSFEHSPEPIAFVEPEHVEPEPGYPAVDHTVVEPEPAVVIDLIPERDPSPDLVGDEREEVAEVAPQPTTAAGGALGIDIPGFSTLAPAVQPIVEPVATPTSSRAQNGSWASRVLAEDAAQYEQAQHEQADVDEPQEEEPAVELPNLTPQAARAIAAAAQASTEAERDAALAMATGPNDEPLDRDLLLRFLSSVKR